MKKFTREGLLELEKTIRSAQQDKLDYINKYFLTEECKKELLDWASKNPSIALALYGTYYKKYDGAESDNITKPNGDLEEYVVGMSGKDGSIIYALDGISSELEDLIFDVVDQDLGDEVAGYLDDKGSNEDVCNWGFDGSDINLLGEHFSLFSYRTKYYKNNTGIADVYIINMEYPNLIKSIIDVIRDNIKLLCENIKNEEYYRDNY